MKGQKAKTAEHEHEVEMRNTGFDGRFRSLKRAADA